jgi:3-methyladenine DNA glycosylase AlkC
MIRRINPVAKAVAMSRRKTSTQVIPDKKKYNRKKDKDNANQTRKNEITED